MNLYELTNEFKEMVSQLEEMELDHDVIQDTLDSMQAPIEEKVENIVKYMKSLEALADAKKLEAKRLSDSASADLKKAEFFKNYMADNLNKAGIKKLQAGVFSLKFQAGREVIQIDDTFDINSIKNQSFIRIKKELDKTEAKKSLKLGYEIPGVSLVRNPDSLVVK